MVLQQEQQLSQSQITIDSFVKQINERKFLPSSSLPTEIASRHVSKQLLLCTLKLAAMHSLGDRQRRRRSNITAQVILARPHCCLLSLVRLSDIYQFSDN